MKQAISNHTQNWSHGLRVSVPETSPNTVSQSVLARGLSDGTEHLLRMHFSSSPFTCLCCSVPEATEGNRAGVFVWSCFTPQQLREQQLRAAWPSQPELPLGDMQALPQKVTSARGNFLMITQDLKMTTLKIYISVPRVTWDKLRAVNCWVTLC